MSKQDKTYSRTPEDLERKYNLGRLVQGGNSKEVEELKNNISKLTESLPNIITLVGDCDDTKISADISYPIGFNEENCIVLSAMALFRDGFWYSLTEGSAYFSIRPECLRIKFSQESGWSKYRLAIMKIN